MNTKLVTVVIPIYKTSLSVTIKRTDGSIIETDVLCRIDTENEIEYFVKYVSMVF